MPAAAAIFWDDVLANVKTGPRDTWVSYSNDERAPLLFVSGSENHLMPPSVQQSNAKHQRAPRRPG